MILNKLEVCEVRKISVDELLETKPKQLPFLKPIENEPENYTMDVNRTTVYDVRTHKLIYGSHYVIIQLYDKNNKLLVSVEAFGSNDFKKDEHFYIGKGFIISETSFRMTKEELAEI